MVCPICNCFTSTKNWSFLPRFVSCEVCGGNFLTKSVKSVYSREYFAESNRRSWIANLSLVFFDRLYAFKVNWILSLIGTKKAPKILDYGCGEGKLVERLQKREVAIFGYEPSAGALKITSQKKLPVYNRVRQVVGGYDLIMLWHSLEHTDNPYQVVKKLKKMLSVNGKLLIAVPNADSLDARLTKGRWFHYTYPLHLIHFTPKSISQMLDRVGFKKIEIDYFNPEYTFTGLMQSMLNLILPADVLYSVVCHRRINLPTSQAVLLAMLSLLLLVIFMPLLLLMFLIELIFKKTDAMLVLVS